MGLPKGFRKNIRIAPQNTGPERRQELLDDVHNNGMFLPRGVEIEDMDKSFIEFVTNQLELTLDGEKIPVFFLTMQRWSELSRTWDFTDKFKDLKLPFISIVRQPDVQEGTNQLGLWNIPGHPTYTYIKVPTYEGGRKGIDTYKIPQPTVVDINYEVRLFCNRMKDLNKFMSKVERAFSARQSYISVNGHYMPLVKVSTSDESPIEDFEDRRFYINLTEILLQGYILSEDEFEIIPTINRGFVTTELNVKNLKPRYNVQTQGSVFNYDFIFECSDSDSINFTITNETVISSINNLHNASNPIFTHNGNPVNLPFNVNKGDNVGIRITRNLNITSTFNLIGKVDE